MPDTDVLPTTPQEVLCRAAEVLEERGWTTGDYVDEYGQVCLVAACMLAVGEHVNPDDLPHVPTLAQAALDQLAAHLGFDEFFEVATWNDEECGSKNQAVAVLRAAAGGCGEAPHA
jgi:hypothetical protein